MKVSSVNTVAKVVALTASAAIALYLGFSIFGPGNPPGLIIMLALLAFGTTLAREAVGAGASVGAGAVSAGHAVIGLAGDGWPSPLWNSAYLATALALTGAGLVLLRGARGR